MHRSGTFYLRKAIPHPLRPWAGCSKFVKSLHTRDPKLAARRALDMAEQLEAILGKIRLGAKLLSQAELGALSAHVTGIKTVPGGRNGLEDDVLGDGDGRSATSRS